MAVYFGHVAASECCSPPLCIAQRYSSPVETISNCELKYEPVQWSASVVVEGPERDNYTVLSPRSCGGQTTGVNPRERREPRCHRSLVDRHLRRSLTTLLTTQLVSGAENHDSDFPGFNWGPF